MMGGGNNGSGKGGNRRWGDDAWRRDLERCDRCGAEHRSQCRTTRGNPCRPHVGRAPRAIPDSPPDYRTKPRWRGF